MYAAFVKLLNMSAVSGILIAVIIALRFLLRKIPKKYICILWALAALRLVCSLPKKLISACPVAFGEADVKQRIRGILNYKKPSFWVVLTAAVICIAVAVGFLTNPQSAAEQNRYQLIVGTGYVYSVRVTTPDKNTNHHFIRPVSFSSQNPLVALPHQSKI